MHVAVNGTGGDACAEAREIAVGRKARHVADRGGKFPVGFREGGDLGICQMRRVHAFAFAPLERADVPAVADGEGASSEVRARYEGPCDETENFEGRPCIVAEEPDEMRLAVRFDGLEIE